MKIRINPCLIKMKTKFFTGEGDKGESNLGGGKKIKKNSDYAELLGTLDELNSWVGIPKAGAKAELVITSLRKIQGYLFIVQAEVAALGAGMGSEKKITPEKVIELENIIYQVDKEVPPIKSFIMSGASRESAELDFARTLARIAERKAVSVADKFHLPPELLKFLNRLSSTLFALARYENHERGIKEESPDYK